MFVIVYVFKCFPNLEKVFFFWPVLAMLLWLNLSILGQTCTFTDLKLGSVAVVTIVSRLALKLCLKCRKGKRVRNGEKN